MGASVRSPRNGVSRDEGSRAANDGKELASIARQRMTGESGSRDEAASRADSTHRKICIRPIGGMGCLRGAAQPAGTAKPGKTEKAHPGTAHHSISTTKQKNTPKAHISRSFTNPSPQDFLNL